MKRGIRKVSAVITVAAGATPQNLYLISAGGAATRTAIVRKIWAYSIVGAAVLQIGTGLGAAWAALLPPMLVVNGMDNTWEADEIPAVEAAVNITCQSNVLGIQVQIEVEEIGA